MTVAGLALMACVTSGRADDPATPVREIIKLRAWEIVSYDRGVSPFGRDALARFYTRSFLAAYRPARRLIVEAEDPFATDPIVGGQDSCPLNNIKFDVIPAGRGQASVQASFLARECMSGTEQERRQRTTTNFDVKLENGRWRVDDIVLEGVSFKQGLVAGAERVRQRQKPRG
jgi:hypothetical protein